MEKYKADASNVTAEKRNKVFNSDIVHKAVSLGANTLVPGSGPLVKSFMKSDMYKYFNNSINSIDNNFNNTILNRRHNIPNTLNQMNMNSENGEEGTNTNVNENDELNSTDNISNEVSNNSETSISNNKSTSPLDMFKNGLFGNKNKKNTNSLNGLFKGKFNFAKIMKYKYLLIGGAIFLAFILLILIIVAGGKEHGHLDVTENTNMSQ